tara:strand:- start:64 stop:207 length:144 start_codon:yes stop_codon:yes gene_type:complete
VPGKVYTGGHDKKIISYAGQVGGGILGNRKRFFHFSIKSLIFLSIVY